MKHTCTALSRFLGLQAKQGIGKLRGEGALVSYPKAKGLQYYHHVVHEVR